MRQVRTKMLGQLIGHDLPLVEKRRIVRSFFLLLAEREEFELAEWLGRTVVQRRSPHFLAKTVKMGNFLQGSRVLSAWRAGRDSNP